MAKKKSTPRRASRGRTRQPQTRLMSNGLAETVLRAAALLADLPYVYVCWKYLGTPTAFVRTVEQTLVEHLSRISTPDQLVSLRDQLRGLTDQIDRYFGESGNNQLVEDLISLREERDTPDLDVQINDVVSRASPNFIQTFCDTFRGSVLSSVSPASQRGFAFAVSVHRDHQLGCPSNIESFLIELMQHSGPPDSWLEHDDSPSPRSLGEMALREWHAPRLTTESYLKHLFRHIESSEPVGDELAQILLTNLQPILGPGGAGDTVTRPESSDFCRLSFGGCLKWIVRWLSVLDFNADCDQMLDDLRSEIEYDEYDLAYDRDRGILRRRGFEDPVRLTRDSKALFEMFYPIQVDWVSLSNIERMRSRADSLAAINTALGVLRDLINPLGLDLKNRRRTGWRIEVRPV